MINGIGRAPSRGHQRAEESFGLIDGVTSLHGLISGSKHQALDTGFRIVTGRGSFVVPIKQKDRILSLALRELEIVEDCITSQGIHLKVRTVAAFKIGNDQASIAHAARRFLSAPARMDEVAGRYHLGVARPVPEDPVGRTLRLLPAG